MYNITLNKDMDKKYYGFDTQHLIYLVYRNQSATVTLDMIEGKESNTCRLYSHTDGYHWLQFWLSQNPNAEQLEELDFESQVIKCQGLFSKFGIDYEQEDKETAILTWYKPIDETFVDIVGQIVESRFANRERFFN